MLAQAAEELAGGDRVPSGSTTMERTRCGVRERAQSALGKGIEIPVRHVAERAGGSGLEPAASGSAKRESEDRGDERA